MKLRKNGEPDKRCRSSPGYIPSRSPDYDHWTPERDARYWAQQWPNPKHVAILRRGIAEFRQMLAGRELLREIPVEG